MNLFQLGKFKLHSGAESQFKIECDALTDDDWRCLAAMVARMVGQFREVYGVPTGGVKLAEQLKGHQDQNAEHILICDDVTTTGRSMWDFYHMLLAQNEKYRTVPVIGAVVFARGKCPGWVRPLFQLDKRAW